MRALLVSILLFNANFVFAADSSSMLPPAPEAVPNAAPVRRDPARIPSALEAEEMNEEAHSTRRFGFFVGLDANFGRNINFTNATLSDSGTNYSGSATMVSNLAVGLRVGGEYTPRYNFGFSVSATFETPRTVSAINNNLSNVPTTNSVNSNATIQFNLIEANAIYRWNQFYIPVGLNYSLPVASNFGNSFASYTFSGMVGGQGGIGGIFYGDLHVELLLSLIDLQMHASGTDSSSIAYSENFGTGIMTSAEIRTHYTF